MRFDLAFLLLLSFVPHGMYGTPQIKLYIVYFISQGFRASGVIIDRLLDHTKQHCRNTERSMINPEAWTPVIINSQCSSIKWIERSTKYPERSTQNISIYISIFLLASHISVKVITSLSLISNQWMRLSRILRIKQIEEGVILRGRKSRWITYSEICLILHILRKPNSLIALLFVQNNS